MFRGLLLFLRRKRPSSFTYLNSTQFLGALLDNIFKLLVVFFCIQQDGIENSHKVLSISGAIFVIPFLLFSTTSGNLADRFSKRDIIVLTKIFELVIMGCAVISFTFESKVGSYLTLFLLATQSAFFGPSKYGIIPEIVKSDKITSANGLMTSFTFLAIILGNFLASFLTDITYRNFILCSIICTIISLAGVIASFGIQHTPPSGAHPAFNLRILHTITSSLKLARQEPFLLNAVIGSAFFLFIGSFAQLNMIPFAVNSLGLTYVQGGYLFLLTALGIGTGSMIAGKLSGKSAELALVPLGALGITVSLFLLYSFSTSLYVVLPAVTLLGLFGGIYMIPLDSYIQIMSPNQSRGQIVAATNFLSFFGVLCSSVFIYLLSAVFDLKPHEGFSIMGFITLGLALVFTLQLFDHTTRFLCMILSKLHFNIQFINQKILTETPTIYICQHTAWNDTLLMLGSQRRRIRFFIEKEQEHTKFMLKLYHLLKIILLPQLQPLKPSTINHYLEKGFSLCILTDSPEPPQHLINLIKNTTDAPIVNVCIEKSAPPNPKPILNKFRIPATVTFYNS